MLFATDETEIGTTPLIKMTIDTGDHPPIAKRPYTLALKHDEWARNEIEKLLEAGVIRGKPFKLVCTCCYRPQG